MSNSGIVSFYQGIAPTMVRNMDLQEIFRHSLRVTPGSLVLALIFGAVAAGLFLLDVYLPVGGGLYLEPSEIFVTLGSALTGPIGGLIIGFLQGIVYAPERNVPSHMLAGFLWGLWYAVLWVRTRDRPNGKVIRILCWTLTIPVYYYVLLLPLHQFIYATVTLQAAFIPTYLATAKQVIPEVIGTILATGILLVFLIDRYAKPVNWR